MSFIKLLLEKEASYTLKKPASMFRLNIEAGYFNVFDATNRQVLSLRERRYYPKTFCEVLPNGDVFCGYGAKVAHPQDEFLHITLRRDGTINVSRDINCTLPLFYGKDDSVLAIGSDYGDVYNSLSRHTFNEAKATEVLMPVGLPSFTACREINILQALETLEGSSYAVSVSSGIPRQWAVSRDAPESNPKDFVKTIESSAERLFQKIEYFLEGAMFEASGGIDSSFLPLYFAQRHPGSVKLLASKRYSGVFGITQEQKLNDLEQITGATGLTLALGREENGYPLSDFIMGYNREPFYYLRSSLNSEKYVSLLSENGCKILLTGSAGDELFSNIIDAEQQLAYGLSEQTRRQEVSLPSFLTETFRNAYIACTDDRDARVMPQLAVGFYAASQSRNGHLIDHDIWPVSPFADLNLYAFCQGLPIQFRTNKNIFRAYFQAKGWPKSIYQPRVNEDTGDFFNSAMTSGFYDHLIEYFSESGYAVQKGWLAPTVLRQSLATYKNSDTSGDVPSKDLFTMYLWLVLEIQASYFQDI